MSRGLDPNFLRMQQEYMRHKGLESAKKIVPDKKNDLKYVLVALATIVFVCATLAVIALVCDKTFLP